MTCFHPLKAYRKANLSPEERSRYQTTGHWPVVFNPHQGYTDMPVDLPCGQCVGCRIQRSREWAARCMLESLNYTNNYFITLTYNPENLPEDRSLHYEDVQKFFKRLRKKCGQFRYFLCGEYGALYGRPHYHAIVFGLSPRDVLKDSKIMGPELYSSPNLEKIWGKGFVSVGFVTWESCAYVSRYVLKKITGPLSEEHYHGRVPEFVHMSTHPGIASNYLYTHVNQLLAYDTIVIPSKQGIKQIKMPKFFEKKLENIDCEGILSVRERRTLYALEHQEDSSLARMKVRESLLNMRLLETKFRKFELEN